MSAATPIDTLCIDTLRTLAMDAVQAANSGHPGTPMALAPIGYCLWQRFLRYDPEDPIWPNRDRFVLSNGHASMLLYGLLHLAGVKAVNARYERVGEPAVSLDDIRKFRQLGSKCPGHPEYRWTSGVECTTGPLGTGAATTVGLAAASRWLAARYNRPELTLFDYDVYAILGDGDLMEGVCSEAASLAGHLRLDNLCWFYDNNEITIEGPTSLSFGDDVATRFLGYGWNVLRVGDANDLAMLSRAIRTFHQTGGRPTLIIVDTHIAWGSPNLQDTAKAHGEPLGADEIRLTKRVYGWPEDAHFLVPDGVREHFAEGIGKRGSALRTAWTETFARYRERYPREADEIERMQRREPAAGWDADLAPFAPDAKGMGTRVASGKVMQRMGEHLPWLVGGSADLGPSTKTYLTFPGAGDFAAGNYGGRNLHFGIREFAMGCFSNGLALSKIRPYAATFLIFSDFARGAIRLSALMELPVVWIFTHDSIGVGEDGPTHQPVEQLASLRAIPGLVVLRPADANEVVECWRVIAGLHHQPAALILTRQDVPTLDRSHYAGAEGVRRGAYVLADTAPGQTPDVLLIGTGSEVHLCLEAHEELARGGVASRVISMPSWELFEMQPPEYRDEVLPPAVTARVAVEQGSTVGWAHYVGRGGAVIGMHTFGASAPLAELRRKFGFTPERVAEAAREQIARARGEMRGPATFSEGRAPTGGSGG